MYKYFFNQLVLYFVPSICTPSLVSVFIHEGQREFVQHEYCMGKRTDAVHGSLVNFKSVVCGITIYVVARCTCTCI